MPEIVGVKNQSKVKVDNFKDLKDPNNNIHQKPEFKRFRWSKREIVKIVADELTAKHQGKLTQAVNKVINNIIKRGG